MMYFHLLILNLVIYAPKMNKIFKKIKLNFLNTDLNHHLGSQKREKGTNIGVEIGGSVPILVRREGPHLGLL